ncbi:LysR substrate-binding domain-containing protein [Cohaesibacter gelatinilyticus]|mgnify:CR=1 FL=1|uniref:Transcriptional regulator, LysR family n=1 Tax=Cohaesibacter gelatinilyticus TaxID=372072 RepID=A0A285PES2_9HYPH|nr:LysR substrate-binding domain-containing protein [Cohaesibacter gelatinilyticus]SNZ20222.1 transcriptional regulator, LysR family [Cohaesibacter gelatinilyticus]
MVSRHTRIVEKVQTRLKFRQLRLLVAVGRHNNIQSAARDLNVSQPAATKMIQDMELDFEVQLFDRTNRGVIPTEFGKALIRHGQLILAQVANAAQELDDLNDGSSGRVVVGSLLAASPWILPKAIERLLAERPNVMIKVVEGTNDALMPALRTGEIDMVVGRLPVSRHRDGTAQQKLFDESIVAVVGSHHPLAETKDLSFEQLKDYGWILPPPETSLRRRVDGFFISQDVASPAVSLESVSYLANRALLQTQPLISLMPSHVPEQDVAQGNLAILDWEVPFGSGPVGVSYNAKARLSPAAQALLRALQDIAVDAQSSIVDKDGQ